MTALLLLCEICSAVWFSICFFVMVNNMSEVCNCKISVDLTSGALNEDFKKRKQVCERDGLVNNVGDILVHRVC